MNVRTASNYSLAHCRQWRVPAVVITAVVLLTAACSSGAGTANSSNGASVLTLGSSYTPNSLDPAKINLAMQWYVDPAYDPLIYMAPDGSLRPGLATSWNYVGSGNKVFELHLRPNVKFSDGSPLTADVLKANIDYFRRNGMATASLLTTVSSVEVVNPTTVRLTLSASDPVLPQVFTQLNVAGDIVSGPALKDPQKLATQTFGAGPYELDAAESSAGSRYTYVPNPNYWNKTAVHYKKIVIEYLANENSRLAALKTGQIDVMQAT